MYLICENCFQVIAKVDPAKIKLPLMGDQFDSIFPPERNMPGPFQPGSPWQWLRCPHCPVRPIFEPDRLYVCDVKDGTEPPYFLQLPIEPLRPIFEPDFMQLPIESPQVELEGDGAQPTMEDTQEFACPDCGKTYTNHKRYTMYHKCKERVS